MSNGSEPLALRSIAESAGTKTIEPLVAVWEWIAVELSAAVVDGRVWLALAVSLVFGAATLVLGVLVALQVGVLNGEESPAETIGIGLGSGLVLFAASWAALASGGRSSFVPVAAAIAAAIVFSRHNMRRVSFDWARLVRPGTHAGLFVVAAALFYGLTMAPSPRAGVQPVEFMDEAYYSVLAQRLRETGLESIYATSGFDALPALPSQTWYHWGEIWLAAAAMTVTPLEPLFARHYVVLPLVLVATAYLTGSVVRRLSSSRSRRAFLLGVAASLFLAPLPLGGPYFATWAQSMIFGTTMYGLASVVALLGLLSLLSTAEEPTRSRSAFTGAIAAALIPSHVVIAALATIGGVTVAGAHGVRALSAGRIPSLPQHLRRPLWWIVGVSAGTVAWGLVTDHGIGTSGISDGVLPFDETWRDSLIRITIGAGAFSAIPVALYLNRHVHPSPASHALLAGTLSALVVGAFVWGARLGDFTMFHVFFGGLALFGVPAAAVATVTLWERLRARGNARLAATLLFAFAVQLEIGAATVIPRMLAFGPHEYDPVPLNILRAIESLPNDAKLAYSCQPLEEIGFFWDPRLISITAHTNRPVVPMCFQAAFFDHLNGGQHSEQAMSPQFALAPQRQLYPSADARPSSREVRAFLRSNGINYILVTGEHPNVLVPNARLVAESGRHRVLEISAGSTSEAGP